MFDYFLSFLEVMKKLSFVKYVKNSDNDFTPTDYDCESNQMLSKLTATYSHHPNYDQGTIF